VAGGGSNGNRETVTSTLAKKRLTKYETLPITRDHRCAEFSRFRRGHAFTVKGLGTTANPER
jgi:hypothetical protein